MTAMAVTTEELELQEQVARTLESQGVLGKIKAQLRVAVFQAIHGNGGGGSSGSLLSRSSLSTVQSSNDRLQALGTDGKVALEIVRNFLECLELDHTLTVFTAEANLGDGQGNEWRQPSRLCERVGVVQADERTPVLVKMLREVGLSKTIPTPQAVASRNEAALPTVEKRPVEKSAKTDSTRDVMASKLDLPPPPAVATQSFATKKIQEEADEEEDGEAELEASMAEEVVSGSFEEESLAESASLSQSHNDERSYKPTTQVTQRPGRLEMNDKEDDDEDESPAIASPPPVPAKLGTMPPLPGMSISCVAANRVKAESDGEEEEEEDQEENEIEKNDSDGAEDLEDDDADAADRLRSLEAKLKEMEAEDDTGVLQQLKVTKLEDPDEDESDKPKYDTKSDNDGHEEDDDNYGSDFEEVEEDMDEVASELSEDIASMSALSESEEVSVAKAKPAVDNILQNDQPVDNEDALNSYDYIEAVERD